MNHLTIPGEVVAVKARVVCLLKALMVSKHSAHLRVINVNKRRTSASYLTGP